ncbi:MAG: DUF4401 domain-containing protein [Rhodoferax sp.]|nr:DUF4401 domain-containing protein [Rhodoferax sp.]
MPERTDTTTPWYVRVMLGSAGLIAALFLLGFVGIGLMFIVQSRTLSMGVGLAAVAAAFALFRAADHKDFAAMFALAISLAGQLLFAYGLFDRLVGFRTSAVPFWVIAALQTVLVVVMPNTIHRTLSAYAGGLAFAYACGLSGAGFLAAGAIATAIAALWLQEARFGSRQAVAMPMAYGLTLAFLQIEVTSLFWWSMPAAPGAPVAAGAWTWVGTALTDAVFVVTAGILLLRAGWTLRQPRTPMALRAIVALCVVSLPAPGIVACLLVVLLGFSNGNRLLVGAGIVALGFYMGGYYYLLHATLLEKSVVLLVTGLVLLGARWVILRHVMPREHADA